MNRALLLVVAVAGCASNWSAGHGGQASTFADRTLTRVDVTLNGQGPFRFLVDTGAEICLVSERVAARLGLALGRAGQIGGVGGRERAHLAVIDSVAVGGVEGHEVRFAVAPPLAEAFADFLASHNNVCGFLRANAQLDLAGVRFPNPFLPGLRFSLATGLHVIAAHERRHLWQAWRVRRGAEGLTP